MKSLTDIPSEYKCRQNFYRMVWEDLTRKEYGNKGLLFRNSRFIISNSSNWLKS